MSEYKFRAEAVTDIEPFSGGRCLIVKLDLTTPQAKEAFLNLAGDCRGDELTMWMEELGYAITEIDPSASEEAAYLAELNAGYAKDRA